MSNYTSAEYETIFDETNKLNLFIYQQSDLYNLQKLPKKPVGYFLVLIYVHF